MSKTPTPSVDNDALTDVDVQTMRAAHRDSYPMGNIHHGTPERPDWGTFCVECKESWPCEVARLIEHFAPRAPGCDHPTTTEPEGGER